MSQKYSHLLTGLTVIKSFLKDRKKEEKNWIVQRLREAAKKRKKEVFFIYLYI